MAIHLTRLLNVLAVTLFFGLIILLFEWLVINAILGCYTPDPIVKGQKSCVPLSQLFGL